MSEDADRASEDTQQVDGGAVIDGDHDGPAIEQARSLLGHDLGLLVITSLILLVFPFLLVDGLGILGEILGRRIGGYEGLAALVLTYGIVVIGFNILLEYTGLLSFGHAAFFGAAAYAAGIISAGTEVDFIVWGVSLFVLDLPAVTSPLLMVVFGTLVATLLAWPIGFLSIRRSGIYFAVLTLTFGQMLYFWALSPGAALTNGDNGFSDVHVGELFGTIRLGADVPVLELVGINDWEYLFVAFFAVLAIGTAHRIVNSPYGLIFKALGENERRVSFVGLNVFRYKLMAFVISAAFAGVGGSLFVMQEQYIHPTTGLYWITSGDFVIMTVLGGTGSLVGPMFGALVFEYINNVVSGISLPVIGPIRSLWRLVLGAVFVFVVWFFPRGIHGGLVDLGRALRSFAAFVVWAVRDPAAFRELLLDTVVAYRAAAADRIEAALSRIGIGGDRR